MLFQSAGFEQWINAGLLATEVDIELHEVGGVAALEDMAELLGEFWIVDVAALNECLEGVAVEYCGPGVAVVACVVAGGEDVLEVSALVAADDFGDEADAVEVGLFELVGINVLRSGDGVVLHVEEAGSEELGVDEALSVGAGGFEFGDEFVGDDFAGAVVLSEDFAVLAVAAPVLHDLAWQLNEVARHAGAGESWVGALAEEAVECVSELVEEGLALVGGEE